MRSKKEADGRRRSRAGRSGSSPVPLLADMERSSTPPPLSSSHSLLTHFSLLSTYSPPDSKSSRSESRSRDLPVCFQQLSFIHECTRNKNWNKDVKFELLTDYDHISHRNSFGEVGSRFHGLLESDFLLLKCNLRIHALHVHFSSKCFSFLVPLRLRWTWLLHMWFSWKGSAAPCSSASAPSSPVICGDRLCVALPVVVTTCSSEQFGLGGETFSDWYGAFWIWRTLTEYVLITCALFYFIIQHKPFLFKWYSWRDFAAFLRVSWSNVCSRHTYLDACWQSPNMFSAPTWLALKSKSETLPK